MASKLIVLGAVNGQLKSAFSKLSTLHAKNSFALAIIVGDLFADDNDAVGELLAGSIAVPLPTYFTVGTSPLPARIIEKIEKDEEICPNLHFLGKRSTTKTSEGIKIVTLGGQIDDSIVGGTSKEQHLPFHTVGDAKALYGANTADILLTTSWPASIRNRSKFEPPESAEVPTGREHIAELCSKLKPRYHFSVSQDSFYEREPFYHNPTEEDPDFRPLTRFLSLAPYGNPGKQKAIYAFSLPLTADRSAPHPLGTTPTPFGAPVGPRKREALDPHPYPRHGQSKRQKGYRGERRRPPGPGECFFCLSNPTLAQHLISSVGDDAYLTIAKGPLTTAETNAPSGIDFPANVLIIPLNHSPTLAMITAADDMDMGKRTFAEMTRFKESLQNMVAKLSDGKLGAVTYEISRAGGIHTHWQFFPMPAETVEKGLVEAAFRVEAENLTYPPFEVRDPGIGLDEGDFFRVWLWTPPKEEGSEGTTKCLTIPFDNSLRFSLQFGRTVLAKLLGLEKRIQWRDCAQTEDEEKKDMEAFKTAFRGFDFTLQE